ncbi:MAG: hypothetical protein JOZ54_13880, partial [Acidobacteria bacterium]|nr:hypothetical protein [Acidobacteriota bacterium]
NSGIKVILRCDYPRDVTFASQLLQLKPEWLPKLAIGTGIVRLPVRYYTPILFTFGIQPIKNITITDAAVRDQWLQTQPQATNDVVAPPPVAAVSEREEALLRDVAQTPISPITHRYQRLGWHMEIGNRTKDALLKRGLARFDAVSTPRGQVKILTLTPAGSALLAARGVALRHTRSGGAEHRVLEARGPHAL